MGLSSNYRLRQIITVLLFIFAFAVIITGIILYFLPSGPHSGSELKETLVKVHPILGFIATGILLLHLYMNRRPLKRYFKNIFK